MDVGARPDLSAEMISNAELVRLIEDIGVARDFYRALSNMQWKKRIEHPTEDHTADRLRGIDTTICSYSWRSAGCIVAEIRNHHYGTCEDYMDFYCAGGEGTVSEAVGDCLGKMGWMHHPYND